MELVKVNEGTIVCAEEVMKKLQAFQIEKARMDLEEKKIKEAILNAMEEHGIKSFENDFMKVTYVAPTTRKSVDTNALKEEGLYDLYVKESPVKASVKLAWK